MSGGLPNPYRRSSRHTEEAASGIDLEEWVVHGLLAAIGGIGVVVGFVFARPIELALGGLLMVAVARLIASERWRDRTRRPRI